MPMNRCFRITFIVVQLCLALCASTHAQFTSLYIFGDSLSDSGNVQARTAALAGLVDPIPGPYYFQGRFSNGLNYADRLSTGLGLDALLPSFQGGRNYAHGGALTTGSPFPNSVVVQDLDDQISGYLSGHVPSSTELFVIFAGSNDIVNLVDSNGTNAAPIAGNVRGAVQALANAGAREFLVMNLPGLGATPRFNGNAADAALANQLTAQFNATLDSSLDSLELANPALRIHRLDVAAAFAEFLAQPASFGLANVTVPAAPGLEPGATTYNTALIAPNANQYLFWDDLHPTATGHALLADRALAAVPEPGCVLLLGMGLIVVVRRTRQESLQRY
jgi:phospholipase/lecithinase/hemolysin